MVEVASALFSHVGLLRMFCNGQEELFKDTDSA